MNNKRLKRLIDLLGAAFALVFLSPLLAAIALAIKLEDGGPVFFRQERLGYLAKPFSIWKFRTMIVDADRYLDELGRATRPRLTKVGKLLRFTSLDELAQLFNILRGDMSIVGPRPVLPDHLKHFTETQKRRFAMRPGITGLAQVNGRNQLPWSRRLAYDVEYVDNFTLFLDFKILLKTVRVVLLREGVAIDRNPEEVDDLGLLQPVHKDSTS